MTPSHDKQEISDLPTVLRWNIDNDYYKDGITLYVDGTLAINVGGTVIVKSLKGWFGGEKELFEAEDKLDRLKRDNERMRGALEAIRKHQESVVGGFVPQMSKTWTIANKALFDSKALEGGE